MWDLITKKQFLDELTLLKSLPTEEQKKIKHSGNDLNRVYSVGGKATYKVARVGEETLHWKIREA